ncbi:MAG: hypothetical protein HY240_10800 [Actinobacteria bacterium]|nr:hypothetical protein [Actinomycetota bacterium]
MVPGIFTRGADRRGFLRWAIGVSAAGLGAALAACTRGSSSAAPTLPPPSGPAGSLNGIASSLSQVSVLSATTPVNPGKQIFTYVVVDASNRLVTAPSKVWFAVDPNQQAIGPFDGTWHDFTAYDATGDQSPRSPLKGVYVATIEIAQAGTWTALVTATVDGKGLGGTTVLPVTTDKVEAAIGSKATSVKTPVATAPKDLAEICTRTPPCELHAISLDQALRSGKPTVVCFSTPLLCETQLCGPTLDELILVSRDQGSAINAIHVEEFLPGKDLKPPLPTLANASPGFRAWRLQDEPWVFVVDAKGVIRGRLGPGGSVAPEIEQVLQPLL